MGRPRSLKPKLCEHASSGRAYVTLDGKPVYLGKFGTQDAQDKYDCVIAEWIARGRKFDPTPTRPGADPAAPATAGPTLTTVIEPNWTFAKEYYRAPDGNPTSEIFSIKVVLRLLNRLYGGIPAAELDSLKLLALQEQMIGLGWARKTINKHMGRVKRALCWLASRKHIPASVYHEALAVKGVAAGRTKAKETDPVKPVPDAVVDANIGARACVDTHSLNGRRAAGPAVRWRNGGCAVGDRRALHAIGPGIPVPRIVDDERVRPDLPVERERGGAGQVCLHVGAADGARVVPVAAVDAQRGARLHLLDGEGVVARAAVQRDVLDAVRRADPPVAVAVDENVVRPELLEDRGRAARRESSPGLLWDVTGTPVKAGVSLFSTRFAGRRH